MIVCGTAGTYLEMGSDGKAIRRYNYGSGLDSVQKLASFPACISYESKKVVHRNKKWLRLYAQKMYNGHMI